MTTQNVPSAYPVPVGELIPRARSLASELGQVPSRNRLMSELRIGAPKAKAVREALQDGETPSGESEAASPPRLQAVPDVAEPTEPGTESGTGAETDEPGSGSGSAPGTETAPAPLQTPGTQTEPDPDTDPGTEPDTAPVPDARGEPVPAGRPDKGGPQVTPRADPDRDPTVATPARTPRAGSRRVRSWPVLLLAAPAFVAIWSGWVGLGSLTGFGTVHPLPGIWDSLRLNTAITLPIGMETYAAYALRVWVAGRVPARARRFAKFSAIGALALGAAGQVAYHLMAAAGVTQAPWPITTAVSCLPVAVLGMGAALAHLLHTDHADDDTEDTDDRDDSPREDSEEAAR